MDEVTIELRAPVAPQAMRSWVEEQVGRLREAEWGNGVRLGTLWPAWSAQAADWVVAVELLDHELPPQACPALQTVLEQLEQLGIRTRLSVESDPSFEAVGAAK